MEDLPTCELAVLVVVNLVLVPWNRLRSSANRSWKMVVDVVVVVVVVVAVMPAAPRKLHGCCCFSVVWHLVDLR
jgi:hypothetical protein